MATSYEFTPAPEWGATAEGPDRRRITVRPSHGNGSRLVVLAEYEEGCWGEGGRIVAGGHGEETGGQEALELRFSELRLFWQKIGEQAQCR